MAKYYKVTNVSGGTEKGPRGIFLIEVGKLLKPGESAYNARRLNDSTLARTDLEILESATPFKDLSDKPTLKATAAPTTKVKHRIIEAPDGKLPESELKRRAEVKAKAEAEPLPTAAAPTTEVKHQVFEAPDGKLPESEPAADEDGTAKEAATNEGAPPKAKKKRSSKKGKGSSSD